MLLRLPDASALGGLLLWCDGLSVSASLPSTSAEASKLLLRPLEAWIGVFIADGGRREAREVGARAEFVVDGIGRDDVRAGWLFGVDIAGAEGGVASREAVLIGVETLREAASALRPAGPAFGVSIGVDVERVERK